MSSSELLRRMGRKKEPKPPSALILLFLSAQHAELERVLRENGYTVVVPSTADQAVALCLHNRFNAALIDEETIAEADDWSVARSLKMVRPNLPVLLLRRGSNVDNPDRPEGVHRVVDETDVSQIVKTLRDCVRGLAATGTQ